MTSTTSVKDPELVATVTRFKRLAATIKDAFEMAMRGHVEKVEDASRIRKYLEREDAHWNTHARGSIRSPISGELGQERLTGVSNDLLSIEFFEEGLIAARSIGKLTVGGISFGTGFLVGNGMLMTNHHVLRTPEEASLSQLDMDLETNRIGAAKPVETYELDPERIFITNKDFDFTIVAVRNTSQNGRSIDDFGFLPLIGGEGKILIGRPVNLIQHPNGGTKSIVVHDSRFMYLENGGTIDRYCWYSSDTEPGSSGSPVFNNRWEVVALHHRAVPDVNANGKLLGRDGRIISTVNAEKYPERVSWVANEGIRISRLVGAIQAANIEHRFEHEREKLMKVWSSQVGEIRKNALSSDEFGISEAPSGQENVKAESRSFALNGMPISISIRIG